MLIVSIACALAAIGLWCGKICGARLALLILAFNVIGDISNTILRHDYRSLIGVPIGGAMIVYVMRDKRA
jgi:hypothetical protein